MQVGDGAGTNVNSPFRRKESHDLNPAILRMFAMMMRIICRTRVQLEGYGKAHSGTFCAARPLTPSPRAGRLFAACRATGKTEDATRFRRVGIPSRNVRLDKPGWNGIDREIDVATFVFPGTSQRSGEVSETLDAKRAPRPPHFFDIICLV